MVKQIENNLNSIQLLKSSTILYVLLFIALANMYSYVMNNRQLYVVFMLIIGFLTSFFSKNMIVVLFLSIVIPNIIRFSSDYQFREGFEENANEKVPEITKPSFTPEELKELVDIKSVDHTNKTNVKMKMDNVTQNMTSMQDKIKSALKTADKIKDEDKKKSVKSVLNKQLAMITTLSGVGSQYEEIMNDLHQNVPQLTKDDFSV